MLTSQQSHCGVNQRENVNVIEFAGQLKQIIFFILKSLRWYAVIYGAQNDGTDSELFNWSLYKQ